MFWGFSMLLGCGQKTPAGDSANQDSTSDTAPEVVLDCGFLNEDECVAEALCTPIMAAPIAYNETEECWEAGEKLFQECMSADMNCGVSIVHARRDSNSDCMRFDNTCIPVAWLICNEQAFLGCGE